LFPRDKYKLGPAKPDTYFAILVPQHLEEDLFADFAYPGSIPKPGGALSTICDNWVSRLLFKGEDAYGLGRWSYVTLHGKGSIKITVITAYNATPSPGPPTAMSSLSNTSSTEHPVTTQSTMTVHFRPAGMDRVFAR
jgi:hypothetical protein